MAVLQMAVLPHGGFKSETETELRNRFSFRSEAVINLWRLYISAPLFQGERPGVAGSEEAN
jgi:hypothetical protein